MLSFFFSLMKKASSELKVVGHDCSWHFQCRGELAMWEMPFAQWKEMCWRQAGTHTSPGMLSVLWAARSRALMDGCLAGEVVAAPHPFHYLITQQSECWAVKLHFHPELISI